MFKRANKVTALLVAAASVMATVPAMAADTVRLGNKEGTVKQGVAYGDGSYAYYGYRTDDDDTGVYYNNDGGATKEKLDSDLEDYRLDSDSKYGTKYVYARESSNEDEYLVDLSSGKIDEDNTAEEQLDDAKSSLVTKIKKADRYESIIDKTSTFDNIIAAGNGSFEQVLRGQFGDVWYKFSVTTSTAADIDSAYQDNEYTFANPLSTTGDTTTSQVRFMGFTNDSGKYIDLSKETSIKVFSTKTGRAEEIKEYGEKDKDSELTVNLINVDAVAQDKDNIYAIATVQVIDDYETDPKFIADGGVAQPETQYFLQKISKTQGGKDDDEAYTSKEITSYQIADNKTAATRMYDNGDMTDAYKALFSSIGSKGNETNQLVGITVKDSSLYVVRVDSDNDDKLHIYKLDMKKYKDEALVGSTLTKDVDYYGLGQDDDTDNGDIVEFDEGQSSEDDGINYFEKVLDYNKDNGDAIQLAGQDLYRIPSVTIDTTGTIWALEKGKVIKFTKLDDSTVYTVDRAMDALDVYDENNMIIWDTEGDVYTNISEGKKQTESEGLAVNPDQGATTTAAAQIGWVQDATTGAWNFYDVNGTKTANYWANDNGTWYWIKEDGTMATGWAQDTTGTWYYLNPTSGNQGKPQGAMLTGWQEVGGSWYYMYGSGAMAADTTIDGYYVNANGAWV